MKIPSNDFISRDSRNNTIMKIILSWWKGQKLNWRKIVSWPYLMEKKWREAKIFGARTNRMVLEPIPKNSSGGKLVFLSENCEVAKQ